MLTSLALSFALCLVLHDPQTLAHRLASAIVHAGSSPWTPSLHPLAPLVITYLSLRTALLPPPPEGPALLSKASHVPFFSASTAALGASHIIYHINTVIYIVFFPP